MTFLIEVQEYDHWIKQAWGIITLAVLSITTMPQEHIQPTKHIKIAVSHSNGSSYSSFCHITFQLASRNNVETFPTSFETQWLVSQYAPLCWESYSSTFLQKTFRFPAGSSRCLDDGNRTALLCTNTSSPLSYMYSSTNQYVPSQLTPVPTYTSGCVFSHLRLVCDMYSNIRTRLDTSAPESALQLDLFLAC